MSVITRFAPSPTGFLHIGGARTALFNYLFARHYGGRYLLRIEDTDKQRSTDAAVKAIQDGLNWLGLAGDAPPIFQSAQIARHVAVASELITKGAAYRCYLSESELDELRKTAYADGKPLRSPWRDKQGDTAPNTPFVIRLKMPDTGESIIQDLVQGSVSVQNQQLDDFVLLRSDGTPTYMLAVVVDDHDMGITHILRGDDHLNNAHRQQKIYEAMGWGVPIFGHIPLIHGPDGAKLSKRHGALGVGEYDGMGYLPEAMINYLCRLGWSHGDDEFFSTEEAISWFDGTAIGKSPARFDFDKLAAVNQHWMRQMDPSILTDKIWSKHGLDDEPQDSRYAGASPHAKSRLTSLMPLLTERAKTLNDLVPSISYLLFDGAPQIEPDAAALLDDTAKQRLVELAKDLPNFPDGDAAAFKAAFQNWLDERGLKMKDIGLPLRAAITGMKQSPSILEIIVVLGMAETVRRIDEVCN